MRLQVQSLTLLSGLRISVDVTCGAGHRLGLDPALLWLWCRPAATAPTGPLAWEPPYATGAALEKAKRRKKKKWLCGKITILPNQVHLINILLVNLTLLLNLEIGREKVRNDLAVI